ncbi:hypothetical protein GALL_242280 [mine drainage metagenome]|uniref:Uncharacterized protein n=1 Tax=mine drainage metagenome TaxID=410659 RepID=A0A1J5S0I2_9ZZZZ
MRWDKEGKPVLEALQMRAQSKIEQIRAQLLPDSSPGLTPDELRAALARKFEGLTPEQRVQFKIEAGIAFLELNRMMDDLKQHLGQLGREVSLTKRNGQAIGAYGQANRMSRAVDTDSW